MRHPRDVFYGWWVLAAGFVSVALVNGVAFWSMGLFIEPLEDEFGWTRTEVSLGFSLSLGVSGLAAPMAGRWVDRKGPRSAILVGGAATAGTFLLLATTQQLWQWYLFLSLNGLLRHFVFIIPFMALTARWFERRRSLAASILGAGLMVGPMAIVPLMSILIDGLEWRGAFVAAGILTAAVVLSLALFVIRNDPADVGAIQDGGSSVTKIGSRRESTTGGIPLGRAVRTRLFWALALGMTFFPFGMVTWITHVAPFYESIGFSPRTAAFLISLSAALAIPPRLIAGHIADRLPNLEFGAAAVARFSCLALPPVERCSRRCCCRAAGHVCGRSA